MSTKDYAECNAEAIKSTTSTVANVTVPKDTTSSKEPVLDVYTGRPTMSTLKLAVWCHAKG
jgi:hypothetical protein